MSERAQTPFILRVECPRCGAAAGSRCLDVGDALASSHAARWDAANRRNASHESLLELDGEIVRAVHVHDDGGRFALVDTGIVVDPSQVHWVGWGEQR